MKRYIFLKLYLKTKPRCGSIINEDNTLLQHYCFCVYSHTVQTRTSAHIRKFKMQTFNTVSDFKISQATHTWVGDFFESYTLPSVAYGSQKNGYENVRTRVHVSSNITVLNTGRQYRVHDRRPDEQLQKYRTQRYGRCIRAFPKRM